MKILFISTSETYNDKRAWSGTVYQSYRGLVRAGFDVTYLCAKKDYRETFKLKLYCTYWLRVPAFFRKSTRMDESLYALCVFKQTLKKFDYSSYDIIFVPTHIAILNAIPNTVKAKIVHLVDATVDSLFEYYSEFSNLWFHNYWEAHWLGKSAFKRSDLIIASSDWCKRNAINQYNINPNKIKVIEFGANIEREDIPILHREYYQDQLIRIYWSGVNWIRKGGDIAYDCCSELRRQGYKVEFHITGMRELPEHVISENWVISHGFLDKNNKEEYYKLIDIMKIQDIFLFPSRAECSSIALCEANAFSLPCFVYDTGGTANYVENDYNGQMLPIVANGIDFANAIATAFTTGVLKTYSQNARKKFDISLNWDSWSHRVLKELNNLVSCE